MTSVTVPAAWVARGTLPACCARHGGPTTRWDQRRFDTKTPLWVLLIAIATLVIAVIVALSIRKSVHGRLPACEKCVKEKRTFKLTVLGAWVADVVLLVLAANLGAAGLLLWLLATLAALVWSFAGGQRYRVHGRLSDDQMWVEMHGASEEFATAIDAVVRPTQPAVPAEAVAVPAPAAAPEPAAAQAAVPPPAVAQPEAAQPLFTGLATRPTLLPKL